MSLASLALLAMLGVGREPDASALVARLGAARFAEREAAARALLERGRLALPALRRACDDKDPEVRARASALVDRIESESMIRPTLVRLDYDARPLPEVVRDLAGQSGLPLALDPDQAGPWSHRRVSLREAGPVTFWEAIDALCRAERLRADLDLPPFPGTGEPAAGIGLSDASGRLRRPWLCDSGPFRVKVQRVDYERHRDLDPPAGVPEEPAASELFQVQLQVLAEPRLLIGQAGALRLDEATDDLGQSLRPVGPSALSEPPLGFSESAAGPSILVPVPLRHPERPGRLIRRLRGRLPLIAAARRPEPLTIPLADSSGKTFRRGGISLSIEAIRSDPNEPQATIELALRPGGEEAPAPTPIGTEPRPSFLEHQFEVIDAQGRPFLLFAQERGVQAGEYRLVLIVSRGDGAASPERLRYFSLSRAETELEFRFEDIEMD